MHHIQIIWKDECHELNTKMREILINEMSSNATRKAQEQIEENNQIEIDPSSFPRGTRLALHKSGRMAPSCLVDVPSGHALHAVRPKASP